VEIGRRRRLERRAGHVLLQRGNQRGGVHELLTTRASAAQSSAGAGRCRR
jgi:hypothetical protein